MILEQIQFRAEAAVAKGALALLRLFGPVTASNIGGAVARTIGPLLPVSRVAHANLRRALPELDEAARQRIVRGVWDNLGRTVAELPHLHGLHRTEAGPGWEVAGEHHARAVAAQGGAVILVSGHLGNWELLPRAAAELGLGFALFYRAAANPLVDTVIQDLRALVAGAPHPHFPKGAKGARSALAHVGKGGRLALLVDQKMNDGIETRLFGMPAMTAPAAAVFALRYRCPVLPGHVQRLGPARFRLVADPPLDLPDTGDRQADVAALTQAINDCLERWIRERPAEWLWLHRRWPKDAVG
jgi:KDO2-lipid IV(A) lauroyltransferase